MSLPVCMLPAEALKDKVIVITGGGSGLGRSMADMLLRAGARVAIAGRRENVLLEAKAYLLKNTGQEVFTTTCDVRKEEDVLALLNAVSTHFGYYNVLINNAAGNFISPTEKLSVKGFDAIIDSVLKGSIHTSLHAGKYWIEQGIKGVFLNIVTTYATSGSAYVVPSACAKAGVQALTRSLAVEWGKYGIRSNAIAPGPFPTEGAWSRLFPAELSKLADPKKWNPLGRFGEHTELANLAAYLISDYAAYVNGEVVTIDGGECLQGAGQFNRLLEVPDEIWEQLAAMRKKAK